MKPCFCLVSVGVGLTLSTLLGATGPDELSDRNAPRPALIGESFADEARSGEASAFRLVDVSAQANGEAQPTVAWQLAAMRPAHPLEESVPFAERPRTRMQRQLIRIVRAGAGEVLPKAVNKEEESTPLVGGDDSIVLEPLRVTVEQVIALPGIETGKQRFWRTGAIWEKLGSHPAMTLAFRPDRGGLIFNLASL